MFLHRPDQSTAAVSHCDVDGLLARIQEHVLINRIRITELFKDNDPLRSGVITCSRFRQVGVVCCNDHVILTCLHPGIVNTN